MLLDLMWFLCLFINVKIPVFLLLMFTDIIFILYTILYVFTFYMTYFIILSILDLRFLVLARCYLNCFRSVLFSNSQENLFFSRFYLYSMLMGKEVNCLVANLRLCLYFCLV